MSVKIYKEKIKCINILKSICYEIINDNEIFKIINRQFEIDFILVDTYPNKKWNWKQVKIDENIKGAMIEKYINKKWNWKIISRNENLVKSLIEKYPDKDWDWKYISRFEKLTKKLVEKYPDKDWDWKYISRFEKLVKSLIEKYPDKDWDIECILSKSIDYKCDHGYDYEYKINLSKQKKNNKYNKTDINNLIKIGISKNINLRQLSCYEDLDLNLVYDNLDKDWDFNEIFDNNNINFYKIKPYFAKLDIEMEVLSSNRGITMNDIEENMDLKWDMWAVSQYNPNITMDFIKSHPGLIDIQALLLNDNAPIEFIEINLNNNWNWIHILCKCINIHSDFIIDFDKISINEIISKKLSTNTKSSYLTEILKCIKNNDKIIEKRTKTRKKLSGIFPNEISNIIILYI